MPAFAPIFTGPTANPARDAENFEDACAERASLLEHAREQWADHAKPDDIATHATKADWDQIAQLILDLAAYRLNDAEAFHRAGQIVDALAARALPKVPTIPAERARFLADYVEQMR